MNSRSITAAAATTLLALLGLVVLAGGGAVATGLSARPTSAIDCVPSPAPTPSRTAGPSATPSPSGSPTASGYPPPTGPRAAFTAGYLARLHAPASPANLAFLAAWMTAESGPDTGSPTLSAARYNPLNTTMAEPGSWAFNSAGVQNYPSFAVGVTANAATTLLPPYTAPLTALRAGTDPIAAATALVASPWGTGPLVLQLLGGSGSSPTCTLPPASGDVAAVIAFAQAQLGKPYRWAAAGPDSYDCSGLTMAVYATIGVHLPHNSGLQANSGTPVPGQSQLLPGDLVFFGNPIHHVGLYAGNGQLIDAPHTGAVVRYDPLWSDYTAAIRLVTPNPSSSPTP